MGKKIKEVFKAADTFSRNEKGAIVSNSQQNIWLALEKLNVRLRYNIFCDRHVYSENDSLDELLDDAAIIRFWLEIDVRFCFRPSKDFFFTVLFATARGNSFHPVRDYLDGLKWDRVQRIDTWLGKYGEAEDTELMRALSAIVLIAAVRRVRKPGVKFDEMLILEGPQGSAQKSSALAALCPDPAWFSDDLPLDSESKQVIERTAGKWIVEAAELSGMRKSDVERLKSFLSRQVDSARLAYDRATSERPRSFVVIGTTNAAAYLQDSTGNRRFWPVRVGIMHIEEIIRDRDQLWAEAAVREATGEEIRLKKELWKRAGDEQEARRNIDPWEEIIAEKLEDQMGWITSDRIWGLVGFSDESRRTQEHNTRLGKVMQRLGFVRTRRRDGGKLQYAYVRGEGDEREKRIEENL